VGKVGFILSSQSGHSQYAGEVAQREIMRVVDLLQSLHCLLKVYGVLLGADVSAA